MSTPDNSLPEPLPPTPSRRRLTLKPLFLLGGLILMLVVIGLINRFGLFNQAPRAVTAPPPAVAVIKATPGKQDMVLVLPGTLQPLRETQIYARASGYVRQWQVDIGAEVREGQLLLTIDSPETDQSLAHAEAALASARANLEIAGTTLRRSRELLARKFLSQQTVDEQAALLDARAAEVRANEADVRRYRDAQGFEQVTAPFAGRITYRNVEKGQLVTANSPDPNGWLYRLSALNPLRLFVNVPQNQARFIHAGMPVAIRLSEFPGQDFQAQVVRTAGALDPSSKTLLTEIHIPNDAHTLASGSYAEAHFSLHLEQPAIILPANTLIARADGTRVATLGPDNHIHLKQVKMGRDFGTTVEIISGVDAGETIVTNPSDAVQEGVLVHPIQARN